MKDYFIRIINDYISMYNSPYKPTKNKLAKVIEKELPNLIIKESLLDTKLYVTEGSVGQGNWTDTPWVSVFDKEITTSAQKGFYIVYLFRKDMKGVYLSLNQGTKYIKKKYKGNKPKDKMKTIAANIREDLTYDNYRFPLNQIDLNTSTDNGSNYMAAHICGKFYPSSNIPSNSELFEDIQEMVKIYLQLKALMTGKDTEEMLDFYLQKEEIEDLQFQNNILVATPAKTTKQPHPIPPKVSTTSGREFWRRNPGIAKDALQNMNYICETNAEHSTFESEVTNKNFVEAHHLIPIKAQNIFINSLDVQGNIVSLCPNCHRKIHHATKEEKKIIIKYLYKKHKKELSLYGILIPLKKLYKLYKC